MATCYERLAEALYEVMLLRGYRAAPPPPGTKPELRRWLEEAAAAAAAVGRRDVAALLEAARKMLSSQPCIAAAAVEGSADLMSLVYLRAEGAADLYRSLRRMVCRG